MSDTFNSWKLDFNNGISVYMYKYPGKLEFVWTPPPSGDNPYSATRIAAIDARFIPWVKQCLGEK